MSGVMQSATAKPSRARIPCDHADTGRSNAAPRPLISRMQRQRGRAPLRVIPASTASISAFSSPVRRLSRPASIASSEPTRPRIASSPRSAGSTPARTRSSVVLPEPERPDERDRLARLGGQVDALQAPDGLAAAHELRVRGRDDLARAVQLEAHADVLAATCARI